MMPTLLAGTDVVSICSNLIRFDTTNYERGRAQGESSCVDYIESVLSSTPFARRRFESTEGRSNLVVTVTGTSPDEPALVCQGHLDVVPADAAQWSFDPFGGAVGDGYVHGRGAVDMKDFIACMIRVLLTWSQTGARPTHTTHFVVLADEETDGEFGAVWLVNHHPELFTGVAFALGEAGGMQTPWVARDGSTVNFYPIAAAERGTAQLHITAHGTAGHGSFVREDNAVVRLARAVTRLADHHWPVHITDTTRAFLETVSAVNGLDARAFDLGTAEGLTALVKALGPLGDVVRRSFQPSSVPTMMQAGYKVNVIPEHADAMIDVRTLPGDETAMLAEIDTMLGPHVTRSFIAHEPALESPLNTRFYTAIGDTLRHIDSRAVPIPFCTGGGTDAKAFSRLGILSYGFSPTCRGPQGQQAQGAHGVDERVPVESLHFAQRVLGELLMWP